MEGELKEEEYDTENVTVQIVELSTDEIAKSNNWIGANKPIYEGEQSSEDEACSDDNGDEEEEIPGFTVTSTKSTKKPTAEKQPSDDNEIENTPEEGKRKKYTKIPDDIKSKRALGQLFAKRATNSLKNTKAFRLKDRLERNRLKKKARVEKEKRIKLQNKREKHKKNSAKGKSTNKSANKSANANKLSKKGKHHRK